MVIRAPRSPRAAPLRKCRSRPSVWCGCLSASERTGYRARRGLTSYRLMTAEIVYSTEDAPEEQAIFVWSDFDHMPDFPRLKRFLDYWQE